MDACDSTPAAAVNFDFICLFNLLFNLLLLGVYVCVFVFEGRGTGVSPA